LLPVARREPVLCDVAIQGRVAVGSDADLVVWDASTSHTVSAKSQAWRTLADVNVYDGMSFVGAATHVIRAGLVVFDDQGVRVLTQLLYYSATLCVYDEFPYKL